MDLDNIQRKYGLPAPLPVVQNGKFATRFPLNLEHRGDDVFQFGGKYIGEIENIYDLLYKILTNQEIDASLALPYAIKITEDKLYIRDKTNSEWILIFDITKPNFPKEIELYELIYKAITHQVIGEDTSYPGQFKIEENILYVRDKDNLTWTQIGDVTKEFLGATEATQDILDQVNEILTEVQELKTELNRQIATTNETLTTALQAANEAMTSAQSINIRTFNSVEEMKASNTLKAGALAKTQGFYTAGDGGGADYLIINDLGDSEVDEASIITLQNSLYAKLLVQDYVNVKWFGAHIDGIHDDSTAFNNAVTFLKNKYKIFFLLLPDITGTGKENNMYKHTSYTLFTPSGIMKINNTINFELEGIDYIFDNTVIDATEIETEAFLLKGTTKIAYGSDSGMSTKISGCALIGEQKEANVAITFDEGMVNRNITFYNMQIAGFNKQIYLKNHTYMLNFINCNCGNAKYHVYCDDDSTDFGERITFIGGCLGGFETVFYCHNQNVTFFVEACSLDYNKLIFDIENSKLFITGSFIEWNNPYYLGKLSLEKPYVSIVNSQIFYTGNTSNNELVYSTSNGTYQQGRLVLQNNKLIDLDKFPYLITDGFCLLDNNVTESVDSTNTGVCPFVQKTPPKIYLDNSSYAGGCTVTVNSNRDNLEIKTTDTSFYATFDKKIDTKKLYRFACTVETTQQINSPIFLSLSWVVIDKNNKEVEVLKRSTKNIKDILNNAIGNPTRIDDIFVTSNSSVPYTSFANTIYARATFSASDEENVPIGTIINIKRLELAEW